jgi:hypothetical protein
MAAVDPVEYIVDQLLSYIPDNIGAALDEVAIEYNTEISIENPLDYFIYQNPIGYRVPCIILVPQNIEWLWTRGQNHINCIVGLSLTCVVEDRDQTMLSRKLWRFHAALFKLLSFATFLSSTQKDIVKVTNSSFSQTILMSGTDSIFRKEVTMSLDIEHFEQS